MRRHALYLITGNGNELRSFNCKKYFAKNFLNLCNLIHMTFIFNCIRMKIPFETIATISYGLTFIP